MLQLLHSKVIYQQEFSNTKNKKKERNEFKKKQKERNNKQK